MVSDAERYAQRCVTRQQAQWKEERFENYAPCATRQNEAGDKVVLRGQGTRFRAIEEAISWLG
jgi:hypothetical protein